MALPRDLCDLASVKSFISPPLSSTTSADAVLSALISGVSRAIEAWLGRALMAETRTELRNGTGQASLALRCFPILGVSSVIVDTAPIPPAGNPPTQSRGGYTFDDRFLYATSGFARGQQNVAVVYAAGYVTPGMIAVAGLPQWAPGTAYAANAQIQANGYVFTTATGGTSGTSVPSWPAGLGAGVADGTVSWQAVAEAVSLFPGAPLLPDGIRVAAMQQVALTFRQRTRVGDAGTGEGAQHVSYMTLALHPTTRAMLDPYIDWAFPGSVF